MVFNFLVYFLKMHIKIVLDIKYEQALHSSYLDYVEFYFPFESWLIKLICMNKI